MKLTPDDPRLTAYALDEMAGAERAALEAEVKQSPECRRAVEEIRATGALLTAELAVEPCPQLERGQEQAVLAAAVPPTPGSAPGALWEFLSWLGRQPVPRLAAAAGLVAVTGAALLYVQHLPRPVAVVKTGGTNSSAPLAVIPPATNSLRVVQEINLPERPPALAALAIKLPMPSFKGTPDDLPVGPNIEPFTDKLRAPFLAPVGVENVALHRKVTSSDKSPITGSLDQVTDGNKEAIDDAVVELHKNVQWVQIDLERDYVMYAILIWHDHRYVQLYRCVVVQVADDPDFTQNVRTLFNNDMENLAGLGIGKDKQYFETNQGKLIDTKGVKGRYLRFYSKGSNASALNCYTEVEVYALPR
jgi:hypothetical protein